MSRCTREIYFHICVLHFEMYLQTIGAYTFGCQGGFPEEKKIQITDLLNELVLGQVIDRPIA